MVTGPLAAVTVIKMEAIGPVPHCGLVLAELGADVVCIGRTAASGLGIDLPAEFNALARGKRNIALDLEQPNGHGTAMDLIAAVMERLGLGPSPCLARNFRLVYGRLSGLTRLHRCR